VEKIVALHKRLTGRCATIARLCGAATAGEKSRERSGLKKFLQYREDKGKSESNFFENQAIFKDGNTPSTLGHDNANGIGYLGYCSN